MKKQLFIGMFLFAVLSTVASAADLADYPQMFISHGSFNGQMIVGNSAPPTDVLAAIEISNSLQQLSESQMASGTEDEFNPATNSILIGLPCQNSATAAILGTDACDIGLANGTGYLKFVEKNGSIHLIVTGKTAADTRKAARALAKYKLLAFLGSEMLVAGTLEDPQLQRPAEPVKVQPKPECGSDSDCPDDKWCSAGKCAALDCPPGTKTAGHDCTKEKAEPVKSAEAPATAGEKATHAAPQETQATQKTEQPAKKPGLISRIISFFRNLFM